MKSFKLNDVPDFFLEEIDNLSYEMGLKLSPCIKGKSATLVMAAFTQLHASLLCSCMRHSPEELPVAVEKTCECLKNTINLMEKVKEK